MKQTTDRLRVYELAREMKISSKELLARLRARGLEVRSHMAALDGAEVARLRGAVELEHARREKRVAAAVRRRRRHDAQPTPAASAQPALSVQPAASAQPEVTAQPAAAPPREVAASPAAPAAPPARALDDLSLLGPRERFERELELARRRAEARRAAEAAARASAAGPGALDNADPAVRTGEAAVGRVIPLPGRRVEVVPHPAKRRPGERRRPARKKAPARSHLGAPARPTPISTPAEHKRVIKAHDAISVQDLARAMSAKGAAVLQKLWSMGVVDVNINGSLDHETAALVASEFGYEVARVAFDEEAALAAAPGRDGELVQRAPVVTVMGHVDHGKTTLLDAIRSSRVAAGEFGGITQHVAASRVRAPHVGDIAFVDTPGHEAFTAMRARGAQVTDIVVLLVAADDGVMPQTIEALDHARDAKVPIVVAINKCDTPEARPERVRAQLAEHGLIPDAWGGDTQFVEVSARTGAGVPALLEAIALQAQVLELRADPALPASGAVIDARLDRGRGPVASVLVQQGTLRVGDALVIGEHSGRVRALRDDRGRDVHTCGPSTPAEISGIGGVPQAGDRFHVTDEKTARQVADHRRRVRREKEQRKSKASSFAALMRRLERGDATELKVIVKADADATAEALTAELGRLSTDRVRVTIVRAGVGAITDSDVQLAAAGDAIIVGFNVRAPGRVAAAAREHGVDLRVHRVIYDAVGEIRAAMAGLLPPIEREQHRGTLVVRQVFRIPKVGAVAGCHVSAGRVGRHDLVRVTRAGVQVFQGKIRTLKRFKEEVAEVQHGYECGVLLDGFDRIAEGDAIDAFEVVEEPATI